MRRQRLLLVAVALVAGVLMAFAFAIAVVRYTPQTPGSGERVEERAAATWGAPVPAWEGVAGDRGSSREGAGGCAGEKPSLSASGEVPAVDPIPWGVALGHGIAAACWWRGPTSGGEGCRIRSTARTGCWCSTAPRRR